MNLVSGRYTLEKKVTNSGIAEKQILYKCQYLKSLTNKDEESGNNPWPKVDSDVCVRISPEKLGGALNKTSHLVNDVPIIDDSCHYNLIDYVFFNK